MRRIERYDSDAVQYREHDLWQRVEELTQRVRQLESAAAESFSTVTPPMLNLLRNYHIDFKHNSYTGDSYSDGNSQAAHWYWHTWSDTSLYTENTTTTRDADALVDGASSKANWNMSTGEARFGEDATVDQPLKKLYATPNAKLFVRATVKKDSGSVADDLKLYCELWEAISGSSLTRLCEGNYITGTATKVGAHSGGTETREYVVEAITSYGTFTSDTTTLISVTNCLPIGSAGEANYVALTWDKFSDVQTYNIYRRISGTVVKIGSVVSGANTFNDRNGAGTAASLPTAAKPVVRASLENFGKAVTDAGDYMVVTFTLYVPVSYTLPSGASDKQWIRIGCKNVDGSTCSSGQLATRSMLIDRVGLGYNYGEITPSAEDLTITGTGSASSPPPSGGGPTGGGEPSDGGGGERSCFTLDQPVTMADLTEKPIDSVEVGELVIVPVGDAVEIAPVKRKIYGWSSRIITLHSRAGHAIECVPSHPFWTHFGDEEGLMAKRLSQSDQLVQLSEAQLELDEVESVEFVDVWTRVCTLEVDHPSHSFIVSKLAVKNLKPLEQF